MGMMVMAALILFLILVACWIVLPDGSVSSSTPVQNQEVRLPVSHTKL